MGLKEYQTKTGVALTLIQGGGQGDGIPRGVLRLVGAGETSDDVQFHAASVVIERGDYIGTQPIELVVKLDVDAAWSKRVGNIDGLVIDLGNWLYRRFNIGAHCPTVGGLKDRAKNSTKTLVFHYEIHPSVAAAHGFRDSWNETLLLQKGALLQNKAVSK